MRVSVSKIGTSCAERLLNDVNVWARVRNDPLLTILTAKMPLRKEYRRWFDGIEEDKPAAGADTSSLRIYLYLTKPKRSRGGRRNVHITAVVNGAHAFCLLSRMGAEKSPLGGETFCIRVSKSKLCPTPLEDLPDPRNEPVPSQILPADYTSLTSKAIPPLDPEWCVCLSPGAWWHYPTETVFFFHLKDIMKSICPAGWNSMTFCAILTAFLDPKPRNCDLRRDTRRRHVDQFGNTDGPGAELFCPCKVPCHNEDGPRRTPLRPRGEQNLLKLLFVGHVETVTQLQHACEPGYIPGDVSRVIRGNGADGRRVPPNCQAWDLLKFTQFASRSLLCGCRRCGAS
uniref:Host range protein n=43 Tax=Psittacid alphaherpesvirus 1 TaxID=50294 RepID=Q99H46_9ALPH|nr:host range protein [Psittacid alphaherpesvirus 1]